MIIRTMVAVSGGKAGRGDGLPHGVVRWTDSGGIEAIVDGMVESGLQYFLFEDGEFFANHEWGIRLCRHMRALDVNVLWGACLDDMPSREMLEEMRLAGCQRIDYRLDSDEVAEAYGLAREFGFEIGVCAPDGTSYAMDRSSYTVAEREVIVERLPGLHSVQFDLAVAYFKARRFQEVMRPLGKAMTLRFPMNELCLNLLACLSAAKHYPDMAAGLLDQAGYGWPHPVVLRNRKLLRSWLESGGDVKGVRLMLEPENQSISIS